MFPQIKNNLLEIRTGRQRWKSEKMRDIERQSRMSNLPLREKDGEKEDTKEFFSKTEKDI